ncbi:hypothetical protein SAMN04487972_107135 [Paracoccus halophilus]|uniref:17 kDa surface antigen n=1 Tax=Paracoccus halophilus TaxID=376733 RepID=A0A099EYJ1_9RHOB|nr:hypothetical protein [Paracoccus halophilus]KGJ03036.1 hypothetical protein IT41_15600 [Paracoccus halophilus]SFA50316.1 hypothetical protein SAMN04487972_107135 [Paracoccus halophilus]
MQKTVVLRFAGLALIAGALSACSDGYGGGLSADTQRAAGGAVAGAVVAKAVDGDVATGALIGAAGGALCDDAGICQRSY